MNPCAILTKFGMWTDVVHIITYAIYMVIVS